MAAQTMALTTTSEVMATRLLVGRGRRKPGLGGSVRRRPMMGWLAGGRRVRERDVKLERPREKNETEAG